MIKLNLVRRLKGVRKICWWCQLYLHYTTNTLFVQVYSKNLKPLFSANLCTYINVNMLYFMMILTSSIFDWKQLFCTNCLFKLTCGTQIDLIILDFIMLTCLFLKLKIQFLNIVIVNIDMQTSIKLKFFVKLNFATQINENILNLMIILTFSILDQKYRFLEHLIQKVKSIGLSSSLVRY